MYICHSSRLSEDKVTVDAAGWHGIQFVRTKYFVDSLRGVQEENLVMLGEKLMFLFSFFVL